jgi:putative transposase
MGLRKITAMLHQEGETVHRNTIQVYMRDMGLAAIYPGPNLSKRNLQHRTYPYLLRGLTIHRPNHVFGSDITYIRLKQGWMYLVAVLD